MPRLTPSRSRTQGHAHAGTVEAAGASPKLSADELVGSAAGSSPTFAEDAKRALSDALAVALEFGHNYIGTEHLLLGLYRNADSTAAWILIEAGALEATARAHVTDMLARAPVGRRSATRLGALSDPGGSLAS